ncbi:MAG: SagB/ThcOx family dehydrogenase [Gemmatimonadaceae bacterium]
MCHARDRIDIDIVLPSGVIVADYAFDRPVTMEREVAPVPDEEWLLTPGATSHVHGDRLTIGFDVLPDDVAFDNGRVSVARTRRAIEVRWSERLLLELIAALSAGIWIERLLQKFPKSRHQQAHDIVADLINCGAVVKAPGARAQVAHQWSMRGAKARGRLTPSEVSDFTFGDREDVGANTISLPTPGPLSIDSLSAVLRRRRSATGYDSAPITLHQLATLLGRACGVTGELVGAGQRLPLRAYPSPGALYAVDVMVIPSRVEGLSDGVFRYDPVQHALVELHERRVDPASFCLPDVRDVVRGIAAFLALSISLPRAAGKYGDESYRILVAEAGCIAQNLVLVAHALGLRAGPFTGVFDRLVDAAVGLEPADAQFVVGVLVGHAEAQE